MISTDLGLSNNTEEVFIQDTKWIWIPYSIENAEERSTSRMLSISDKCFSLIPKVLKRKLISGSEKPFLFLRASYP